MLLAHFKVMHCCGFVLRLTLRGGVTPLKQFHALHVALDFLKNRELGTTLFQ